MLIRSTLRRVLVTVLLLAQGMTLLFHAVSSVLMSRGWEETLIQVTGMIGLNYTEVQFLTTDTMVIAMVSMPGMATIR